MKIGFHELENQVDVFVILSSENVVEFDDVRVVHFVQESNLSKSSLGVSRMLERIKDLLESNRGFCLSVDGFPDMAVSPTPNLLEQFIS